VRLQTLPDAAAGRPGVACPIDASGLHWDEAGVTCLACGRSWPRSGAVPLFVPSLADPGPSPDEVRAPASRNDWRFHLPVDDTTRVLELGREGDGAAVALAYEAGTVIALRESAATAVRLALRARERRLGALSPVAAPLGMLPLPDRSVDVAVIHDALFRVAERASDPLVAQRRLLRALFRKLVPGGLLWATLPNRFATGRLPVGLAGRGRHGLDGLGALLAGNGFARFDAFVELERGGRRHLVPVGAPAVYDYVRGTAGTLRDRVAHHAFRLGLLPRLAPSFAVLAVRGKAR